LGGRFRRLTRRQASSGFPGTPASPGGGRLGGSGRDPVLPARGVGAGNELVEVSTTGASGCFTTCGRQTRRAANADRGRAWLIQAGHGVCRRESRSRGLLVAWSVRTQVVAWTCALANAVQATPALDHRGRLFSPIWRARSKASARRRASSRFRLGCEYLLAGGSVMARPVYVGDPWGRVHVIETGRTRVQFEAGRSIQGRPSFGPDRSLHVPGTDRQVYVFPAARAAA